MLHHNCSFTAVMNRNCKYVFSNGLRWHLKGRDPQVERHRTSCSKAKSQSWTAAVVANASFCQNFAALGRGPGDPALFAVGLAVFAGLPHTTVQLHHSLPWLPLGSCSGSLLAKDKEPVFMSGLLDAFPLGAVSQSEVYWGEEGA